MCFAKNLTVMFSGGCLQNLIILFPLAKYDFNQSRVKGCCLLGLGLPTFCFAIPGHLNTKNSKIAATEAYETR